MNENNLCSAGTLQNACGDLNAQEPKRQGICVHVRQIHFTLQQKLTQHFKATIHQKILKRKKHCRGEPGPIGALLVAMSNEHTINKFSSKSKRVLTV